MAANPPPAPPYRIVLLEDSARDSELIEGALNAGGCRCLVERVDDAQAFSAALHRGVDVILSDYHLPTFDGLAALKLAQEICPGVPFIFVSGALGEELAIETLKLGATDYVLKHRLSKLAPAVRRARAEADEHAVREAAEVRLRQAEKMEIVGRLAAGVAHDFNNLLTIINGFSEILLQRFSSGDPSHRAARMIRNAGLRGTALIQRLLAFSRQQAQTPRIIRIDDILGDLRELLAILLGDEISLEISLDPAAGPIAADPVEIEQMIMNFAANARDAMPVGGKFSIATRAATLASGDASALGLTSTEHLLLLLSDTGVGMDQATQAHIFEPFFTTKILGKGAGLGLWSVRQTIEHYHGAILVDSSPGNGTRFSIYLPVAATATQPDQIPSESTLKAE